MKNITQATISEKAVLKGRGFKPMNFGNDDRCTRQQQYTDRNGQTRTVDYTSDRIGRRTWGGTETITNRRGQQRSVNYLRRM